MTLNLSKADIATERERHLTTGRGTERTKLDRLPVPNLPLNHRSSQLSDLRAPLLTDVPVLLLNYSSRLEHKVPSSLTVPLLIVGMCVTQYRGSSIAGLRHLVLASLSFGPSPGNVLYPQFYGHLQDITDPS